VLTEEQARRCLAEEWGRPQARLTRLDGGMSSATWTVDDRWVLKAVPGPQGDLLPGGLAVARLLAAAGVASGTPRPTRDGALTARADDSRLGLLAWVPGTALTGDSETERRLIGATLARVHQVLAGQTVPGARSFHWVDPAAPHLSLRSWLRPAVTAAVTALERLTPGRWTAGLLHADPAPEAFRHDPAAGQTGIIDWSTALSGPLLYDLASAVMYLGGPHRAAGLTEAYLAAGVISRAEAVGGMAAMLRFRWAVQADYFAWRIAGGDLTGVSGPQENEKGLEDARRALHG
jgi:Ser/Thr protein kinase RdoA (MazF antagonist)